MTKKTRTQRQTEADLEARIHAALRKTFPWLPDNALTHQVRFSFTIGHATVAIDGTATAAQGCADILVRTYGNPLAVLELKRRGLPLTPDDEAQGLSYAKILTPSFPLVVVTNGDDTRILATHSGEPWQPETFSEEIFQKLTAAAARVAMGDIKHAVSTLMGSNPTVWMQAVRATSDAHIAEMSGPWGDPCFPFVREVLFPRKSTAAVEHLLCDGKRFLLIEGAPLVGKSNLLRELVLRTADSVNMAVLFVAANEGRSLLETVADVLAAALAWPVTANEARHWLMQVSSADGPALVLAIDGVSPEHESLRHTLEDLSSAAFGQQLRLVVTVDDAVSKQLIKHQKGREASAIGRRVDGQIAIGLLDDEEFKNAARVLLGLRMGLQHGAASAPELRVPWMLRALGGRCAPGPGDPPDLVAVLPAQLSLDLISHARARFPDDELRRQFGEVARGVLRDVEDSGLPLELKLEAIATFVVRRATLLEFLDRQEIEGLMAQGFLKSATHTSGTAVIFVRLPELLASEASLLLSGDLLVRAQHDAKKAARWLVKVTSHIPLGDIIGAYAFANAAKKRGGALLNVATALIDMPPQSKPVTPGVRTAMHFPGVGVIDVTFEADGSFTAESDGKRLVIPADKEDEAPVMVGDYHPWLILSHLAGHRLVVEARGDRMRLDLELLGVVGRCPHVLRRPDTFLARNGVPTHHFSGHGEVVCHVAGIVEPITFSLLKMLSGEGPNQDAWIEKALSTKSLGLLARTEIALIETAKLDDPSKQLWAAKVLRERIGPALKQVLACAARGHG